MIKNDAITLRGTSRAELAESLIRASHEVERAYMMSRSELLGNDGLDARQAKLYLHECISLKSELRLLRDVMSKDITHDVVDHAVTSTIRTCTACLVLDDNASVEAAQRRGHKNAVRQLLPLASDEVRKAVRIVLGTMLT